MQKMPIRTKFTHEELACGARDRAELARMIAASGGYALVEMHSLGLMPHIDDLLAVIDGDSLSFVLDHYKLDLKQKRSIAHLFSEQLASVKLSGAELTEPEINARLDEGLGWIKGAQLTQAQLTERPAAIAAALDACVSGAVEDAVGCVIQKMSANDLVRLDERVWERCLSIFCKRPDVLALPEGKARYKKLILAKAARDGMQPRWCDFKAWSFEPDDEAFFWSLIDNVIWRPSSFENVVAVPGCSAFIDKMGYAERVNPGSIRALDAGELTENLQKVQKLWLDLCAKGDGGIRLLNFDAHSGQFEEVVTETWMLSALLSIPQLGCRFDGSETSAFRNNRRWASMQALKCFLKDPEAIIKAQGGHCLLNIASALTEDTSIPLASRAESVKLAEHSICALVPFCIDARGDEGASCLINPGRLSNEKHFGALSKVSKSNPSSNLLWALLNIVKRLETKCSYSRYEAKNYLDLACKASLGVSPKSGKLLWDALAPKAHRKLKPKFKGLSQAGNAQTDLIGIHFESIFDLPRSARRGLMMVHPNFAEEMQKAGQVPDSDMLLWALKDVEAAPSFEATLWCRLFALAGRASLECPKLAIKLRAHPHAVDLVNETWLPFCDETENLTCAVSAALQTARRAEIDFEDAAKTAPPTYEKKEDTAGRVLSEEVRRLEASGRAMFGSLAHKQARENMSRALNQGHYAFFEDLADWREPETGGQSIWESHVRGMGVDVFCESLNDTNFARMIRRSVDYLDECKIGIDFKCAADNARACESLLPLFDEESCSCLALFSRLARKEFAADFVVDKMGSQAFYNYKLLPGQHSLVPGFYTSVQIIRLFDKLEIGQGVFDSHDINARTDSLFCANFLGRSTAYLDVLKRARSRPKLYAMLFNVDICDQFGDKREAAQSVCKKVKGQDSEPRQAAGVRWAADHVDWNIIADGIELILDEAWVRRNDASFNTKLALQTILVPLRGCRARGRQEVPGDPDGYALISESISLKMANILLRKAPSIFYTVQRIGAIAHLPTYFELNPKAFDCPELVERLFLPDRDVCPAHFDLRQWGQNSVVKIAHTTLQWLLCENRIDDIRFIDWMVKEVIFRGSELAYEAKTSEVPGFPRSTGGALECCIKEPDFTEALGVAIEKLCLQDVLDRTPERRRVAGRL